MTEYKQELLKIISNSKNPKDAILIATNFIESFKNSNTKESDPAYPKGKEILWEDI